MAYARRHLGMLIHVDPQEAFRRLLEALRVHDGQMGRAARHLGISYESFRRYRLHLIDKGYPVDDHVHRMKFDAEMRKIAEQNTRNRELRERKAG